MKKRFSRLLLSIGMLAGLAGCTSGPSLSSTGDGPSWDEFLASTIQDPLSGAYVVEGDLPIATLDELRAYYDARSGGDALVINLVDDGFPFPLREDRWETDRQRRITYCVNRTSLGWYDSQVIAALDWATAQWEAVANIDFVHLSQYDATCSSAQENVLFDVRGGLGAPGQTTLAFFPSFARARRTMTIYEDAIVLSHAPLTLRGMVLHELGHALGFGHEHLRAEAPWACPDEPGSQQSALTPYDSGSVMHAVDPRCSPAPSDYDLTARDAEGAALVYGAPARPVSFPNAGAWTPVLENWCSHTGATRGTADFTGSGGLDLWCHDPIVADSPGRTWVLAADGNRYQPVAGRQINEPWLANWCGSPGETFGVGDFDGDGKSDIMCHDAMVAGGLGRTWVARSTGTGFASATGGSVWDPWLAGFCGAPHQVFGTADFNGDRRTDLYCRDSLAGGGTGELRVALSTGTGFVAAPSPWATGFCNAAGQTFGTADFNSDGKNDVWCRAPAAGDIYTLYSTGSELVSDTGSPTIPAVTGWCRTGSQFGVADMDRDRRGGDDLYCHGPNAGTHQFRVMASRGRGFASRLGNTPWIHGWCTQPTERFGTGDFNGDGRADLFCRGSHDIWVGVSTGTPEIIDPWTIKASNWCTAEQLLLTDVDRNGAADLQCFDAAGPGSLGRTWLLRSAPQ